MASNFIDNSTSLPATKSNAVSVSVPSTQALSASDVNTITQALYDTRTVILREYSLMSYGADPTNTSDNSGAFVSAFTAMGSSPGILHIPVGVYKLTANVVVPGNVTLRFDSSSLNILTSITLTVNGNIDAPPNAIFSGGGNVTISATSPEILVYNQWFTNTGINTINTPSSISTVILRSNLVVDNNIQVSGVLESFSGSSLQLLGNVTSISATANILNSAIALNGGKIASFQNNNVEEAYVDYSGNLYLGGSGVNSINASSSLTLKGNQPAANTAPAVIFDNPVALTVVFNNAAFSFRTGGVEVAQIDTAGNFLMTTGQTIGTTMGSANLTLYSNRGFIFIGGGIQLAHFDLFGDLLLDNGGYIAQNSSATPLTLQGNATATGGPGLILKNSAAMNAGTVVTQITNGAFTVAEGIACSTNGCWQSQHFGSLGNAPTVGTLAAGWGTAPTVTVSGGDSAMIVSVTAGTTPSTIGAGTGFFTVTLNQAYATINYGVTITVASATSATLVGLYYALVVADNQFIVYNNTTTATITSGTTYRFFIQTFACGTY